MVGPGGRGKTELLLQVAKQLGPEAVLVRVPSGLDQAEAVVLQVAGGLGEDALREVDARLSHRFELAPALAVLHRHLGDRKLLVDDLDRLASGGGGDDELHRVVKERRSVLEAWLGEHASLSSGVAPMARVDWRRSDLEPLTEPPLRLANGAAHDVQALWLGLDQDPARFRLALALAQVEGRPPDPSLVREESLLEAISAAMPISHRAILRLLAVHGRPLPDEILRVILPAASEQAIAEVRSLAAVGSDDHCLWVAGPLLRHFRGDDLAPDELVQVHLSLATAFAGDLRGDEPSSWLKAPWLVEAHRHYAAGREPARALQFARYGVALLLDLAREQSRRREFNPAAAIYADVLKLDEQWIGRWAWAYAEHYLHYNRYKAKPSLVEPISETERGYRSSVERWPENALFWSRLALTQFVQGERGRALKTLQEARSNVPEHVAARHTGKEWYLRGRTVQHLLRFEPPRVVEALRVWGGYRATDLREQAVERELLAALARGFRALELEAADAPTVHLHREVTVEVTRAGEGFACSLRELCVSARAEAALAALSAAVVKLRAETTRLRGSLTHTLPADERAQKQRLLGTVDLVASRLLGQVPESAWVLGRLVADDAGTLRLREVGSGTGTFDIEPSARAPLLPDATPRLARVRAGVAGEPLGPVLELGEPLGLDPVLLLGAWRKRLGDAEPPNA